MPEIGNSILNRYNLRCLWDIQLKCQERELESYRWNSEERSEQAINLEMITHRWEGIPTGGQLSMGSWCQKAGKYWCVKNTEVPLKWLSLVRNTYLLQKGKKVIIQWRSPVVATLNKFSKLTASVTGSIKIICHWIECNEKNTENHCDARRKILNNHYWEIPSKISIYENVRSIKVLESWESRKDWGMVPG